MQRQVSYYSEHNKKLISVTLIQADKKWLKFFKVTGFGAITLPKRRVILDPYYWRDEGIIRHELCHVEQYERLGTGRFLWLYFRLYLKHGYYDHPMEVEARKHEDNLRG